MKYILLENLSSIRIEIFISNQCELKTYKFSFFVQKRIKMDIADKNIRF
jgi:hypothetical protein